MNYQYKVKIMNPEKRKKALTRQLHDFNGRFSTIEHLKDHICTELHSEFLCHTSLDVGYFEGRQSQKVWIVSEKDLDGMYSKFKADSEILLWVEIVKHQDSDDSDEPERKREKKPERKRKKFAGSSKKEEEDSVDAIYDKLLSKHKESFSVPQLRLWARMICCGTHEDYEIPPHVPMIIGTTPRQRTNSFTEALTGAAEAVARAFAPQTTPAQSSSSSSHVATGISPGKSTEIRMKNLQQLRVLHQLHQESILTDKELVEQKSVILGTLRKLS